MQQDRRTWSRLGRLGAVAAALTLAGLSVSASADDEKSSADYQKEFAAWSSKIVDLEKKDANGAVAKEVELIRTLVNQGQAYLASEKLGKIDPLMDQAKALEGLSNARLKRLAVEAEAKAAEESAAQAEKQATDAEAAATAVEARYNELEAQGL